MTRTLKEIIFEMQDDAVKCCNSDNKEIRAYGHGCITATNILIDNKMLKDENTEIDEMRNTNQSKGET